MKRLLPLCRLCEEVLAKELAARRRLRLIQDHPKARAIAERRPERAQLQGVVAAIEATERNHHDLL